MTSDPFEDPAQPTLLDYNELQGSLLLIEVYSHEDHIPTRNTQPGEKNPAIRCSITVLDGRLGGTVYDNALVFPKVMIGQLRPRVGKMVLGRLVQGEASPGKNAPWVLNPATEQDKQLARQVLAGQRVGQSSPPGPPQQQSPWGPPPQQQNWGPPQQQQQGGWTGTSPSGPPPSEPPF